jgi:RHS repeat-associated protein
VYTYDAKGRVTSMTPGSGPTLSYGFDPSGNLTTLPSGATAASGYDHAGELTSSALSGTTTSYAYNADGQRLTAKQGSATITSGTWNGAAQLTAYSDPAASMTSATYDGEGMRASTAITPSGGSSVSQGYVWSGNQLLMDSVNAYIYTTGQTPAEQVNLTTGTPTYLVADSLGSVRGTVNSSGTLTGTTGYDAWGNPQTPGGLTGQTPFGYAGGYTDTTGLIYLINRYYDPTTGQFTSLDPQVDQTLQPYDYAAGNPVSGTDPTGLRTPGPGSCDSNEVPSCRYSDAVSWTQNQISTVVYGHGKSHGIFKGIQEDLTSFMCALCYDGATDWAAQVRADGPWDLKVVLHQKQFIRLSSYAEPNEWPYYARANVHTQIYFNVWGNIFYGFVGEMEGFPAWVLEYGATHHGGRGANTPGNNIERHMGYALYDGGHLSFAAIDGVIQAHIHELSHYCDAIAYPPPSGTRQRCANPNNW